MMRISAKRKQALKLTALLNATLSLAITDHFSIFESPHIFRVSSVLIMALILDVISRIVNEGDRAGE